MTGLAQVFGAYQIITKLVKRRPIYVKASSIAIPINISIRAKIPQKMSCWRPQNVPIAPATLVISITQTDIFVKKPNKKAINIIKERLTGD